MLSLKKEEDCRYDLVSLGEIMLRFDPGDMKIRNARTFRVWEGGGEYNVARGLASCFRMRTGVITAFADNDLGRLAEELIRAGGTDTSLIKWFPYDGIGRSVRNGLNFVERGFGIRNASGTSDRANSASSLLSPDMLDSELIFGKLGARWLHTGGIFAALSENAAKTALKAVSDAKKYGSAVSFDMNYRPSLWKALPNRENEINILRELVSNVDLLFAGENDLIDRLGVDEPKTRKDGDGFFEELFDATVKKYPNIKIIACTRRNVLTATKNDWSAMLYFDGKIYKSREYKSLEIYDRIGGGDAFAAGVIYGLTKLNDPQKALEYGVAHGALAMTTPGDSSFASLSEIEGLVSGGGYGVNR